jgi:hypothetical protein
VLVPALAEPTDRGGEIGGAGEAAAAKGLTVDDLVPECWETRRACRDAYSA